MTDFGWSQEQYAQSKAGMQESMLQVGLVHTQIMEAIDNEQWIDAGQLLTLVAKHLVDASTSAFLLGVARLALEGGNE